MPLSMHRYAVSGRFVHLFSAIFHQFPFRRFIAISKFSSPQFTSWGLYAVPSVSLWRFHLLLCYKRYCVQAHVRPVRYTCSSLIWNQATWPGARNCSVATLNANKLEAPTQPRYSLGTAWIEWTPRKASDWTLGSKAENQSNRFAPPYL